MADILAILPGITRAELADMTLGELARWHDRAIARAPRQET